MLAFLVGLTASGGRSFVGDQPSVPTAAFGAICPRLDESGRSLVFSYQGAIWRMPRAGGTMTRLTMGSGFDVEPAWSPNGKYVAYIESRDFFGGPLRLIRSSDGSAIKLLREFTALGKLHFDQAGKRLLGIFQATGAGPELGWLDLQSGQVNRVAIEGTAAADPTRRRPNVALSRDGQWIAAATTLDVAGQQGGNNGPQNDLWRIPSQGGAPQRITRFPARIHDLCWSGDGRSLIVSTELGGVHNDLWEIPLADPDRGVRKLTFGQADEDRPSVSADSSWLVYLDNRSGSTSLMARDLKSGTDATIAAQSLDFRRPTGQVDIEVRDSEGLQTARLALQQVDGKYHAPPGSLYRLNAGELHFYARENCSITVPAGRYVLKAWRGPEYRPIRREVTIEARGRDRVVVELQRWTDMRSRGWISGESHIHANYGYGQWYNSPATMRLQCGGEDLTVANFMVANSDGDGVFDKEFFRGRPDPLSTDRTVLYWNEEFRATIWGHMTLLDLKYLVTPIYTGFQDTTHPNDVPTNADIADHTHDQGGHVNYTHPANNLQDPYASAYSAKGMPLDIALGKVDSIDVMGTGHEANLPVWYRLLNCGRKIPASAGTDVFLNRIQSRLPGTDRAYIHSPGNLTYRGWIDNLKAGRSFVTNGPMLEFSVDGKALGDTVRLSGPGSVQVRGRVESQYPLSLAHIIVNSKIAKTVEATGDRRTVTFDVSIPIERSGWIAMVAEGQRPPAPSPGSGNALFAHTSPIYLNVESRPIRAREDAEYFLAWIDRLWNDVRQRDRIPPSRKAHVEAQIAAGKAFYRNLAAE